MSKTDHVLTAQREEDVSIRQEQEMEEENQTKL